MTLDKFKQNCELAIRANFAFRNQFTFSNPERQSKTQRQRRNSIRTFVANLRMARDPATSAAVAHAVRMRA